MCAYILYVPHVEKQNRLWSDVPCYRELEARRWKCISSGNVVPVFIRSFHTHEFSVTCVPGIELAWHWACRQEEARALRSCCSGSPTDTEMRSPPHRVEKAQRRPHVVLATGPGDDTTQQSPCGRFLAKRGGNRHRGRRRQREAARTRCLGSSSVGIPVRCRSPGHVDLSTLFNLAELQLRPLYRS